MPALDATPTDRRIAELDVLRGIALLFIFVVNLPFLALGSGRAFEPPADAPIPDLVAWTITAGLFTGKSFALFSVLFGMGMVLQMRRAEAAGRAFRALYLRRLAVLALMGLLHGALLFPGDILLPYALAGLVLFLCRRWRPRTYVAWALALMLVGAALTVRATLVWDWQGAETTSAAPVWEPDEDLSWSEVVELSETHPATLEEKAYGVGPLATTLRVNVVDYAGWLYVSSLISFNWRVMAFFFLGAAMMKLDFFAPKWRDLHGRMCAVGLAVGLVIELGGAVLRASTGFAPPAPIVLTTLSEVGATFLSAGYVGAVALLVARGALPRVAGALARTGRMALTNYLGQSLVACLVFRWYGLDLFDRLSRFDVLLATLAIFAGQVLFSVTWLRFARMGPVERLWRLLTYGKPR